MKMLVFWLLVRSLFESEVSHYAVFLVSHSLNLKFNINEAERPYPPDPGARRARISLLTV